MLINDIHDLIERLKSNCSIIAIDFGERKLGIAISDVKHIIAMPLEVVVLSDDKSKIAHILSVITKHNICAIVIGLPLNMNGNESEQSIKVQKFADLLSLSCDLPIYLQDERMTSAAANSLLKSIGMARKNRHKIDDQIAASMILESVLYKIQSFKS